MTLWAYDVRAQNAAYQKQLESVYKVVTTDDDIAFVEDNNCREYYLGIRHGQELFHANGQNRNKEQSKSNKQLRNDTLMNL